MSDLDADARLDIVLVARVLAGDDKAAFAHLVRRHQGLVRAQLRRLCKGDHAMADDLAQESFLLAWRKLDQFRNESRFSTWLYRIAYTCFLQAQRKRHETKADAEIELPETETPCADSGDTQIELALAIDMRRALSQLADGERETILHCYHLDLSHEDTAIVLGIPLGTVKSHIKRGKEKLKKMLAVWSDSDQSVKREDNHE
jgi:RNA polymerase sigma factor (sigma-70 family)